MQDADTETELDSLEVRVALRMQSTRDTALRHMETVRATDVSWRERREKAVAAAGEEVTRARQARLIKGLVCSLCANADERVFRRIDHEAIVVCARCGAVAAENLLCEGEWVRHFEGDEDPSFHGQPMDTRFSCAFNLRTGFAPPAKSTSVRVHAPPPSARDLALLQSVVEMGSFEEEKGAATATTAPTRGGGHTTRQWYKDTMKQRFFEDLEETGAALLLHAHTVKRAQTLFAQMRDDAEQLRDAHGVAAACLIVALREGWVVSHPPPLLRGSRGEEELRSSCGDGEAGDSAGKRERSKGFEDGGRSLVINAFVCPSCGAAFGERKSLKWHGCPVFPL